VSSSHTHRMYLSGMLKQKTGEQYCFTVTQIVNKLHKENGYNYENFLSHFKCFRGKRVGHGYAKIIFICWHVRNEVAHMRLLVASGVSCLDVHNNRKLVNALS
jgi:hypothetical protein